MRTCGFEVRHKKYPPLHRSLPSPPLLLLPSSFSSWRIIKYRVMFPNPSTRTRMRMGRRKTALLQHDRSSFAPARSTRRLCNVYNGPEFKFPPPPPLPPRSDSAPDSSMTSTPATASQHAHAASTRQAQSRAQRISNSAFSCSRVASSKISSILAVDDLVPDRPQTHLRCGTDRVALFIK